MNKEIIEKYIQFAIDNGFKGIKYPQEVKSIGNELFDKLGLKYNLIELITSKDFIKAIARGIINEYGFCTHETYDLTIKQALAIRDNKLEEFINNLI